MIKKFIHKAKAYVNNESGEMYIGEAVKIIIAVVVGALLLAAAVALFNTYILPSIQNHIKNLFDANTSGWTAGTASSGTVIGGGT